jgi:hypothetical protein
MTVRGAVVYEPYPLASTVGAELDALYAQFRPAKFWDGFEDWEAFHAGDFGDLWKVLTDSSSLRPQTLANAPITDLVDVARTSGRYLVPLPYLDRVLVARWAPEPADDAVVAYLSYRRADGRALVRFPQSEAVQVLRAVGHGDSVNTSVAGGFAFREFDPTLPLGLVDVATELGPNVVSQILVLSLAEAFGTVEAAFEKTLMWAHDRTAFGHPLGQFQAIKHLLADVFTSIEMLWSAVETGTTDELASANVIRAFEFALEALDGCVQVHGGRGFAWNGGIAPRLRHVLALRSLTSGLVYQENVHHDH